MSTCNFCMLEGVRAHARNNNLSVTIAADPHEGFPDGISVYAAPPDTPEEEIPDWFTCWLAALPDHCVC